MKTQESKSFKIENQKPINKIIPALPLGDYNDPIVLSSYTLNASYYKIIEPAGEAFERYIEKKLNPQDNLPFDDIQDDEIIEEDDIEYEWEKDYRSSKKFSTGFKQGKEDNYYSLLGLEKEFINATPEEIRKNYKKLALLYHPDKKEINNEKEKEEANKIWIRFQDAYETLSDADKKHKYDSTFKFDDTIPSEDVKIKDDKDFFKIFGPVFLKNSIWSVRKPVPKIGDMNSDLKKVKKFYHFWYSFVSWRDFEIDGEHNLDEAENRWEKRAMLKENKKLKANQLKEEKIRIRALIDLAYNKDPRIALEKKKEEEEKEKQRLERQKEKEKLKLEQEENEKRLRVEAEERRKKEIEDKKQKTIDMKEKLLLLIKDDFKIELSSSNKFQIDLNTSFDNMLGIFSELNTESTIEGKLKLFKSLASKFFGIKFDSETKESSIWAKEEIYNLQRAIKKYPAGTINRYEKIMEIVKTKGINQIIQMTRYITMNPNLKIIGDSIDLNILLGNTKVNSKDSTKELIENKDNKDNKDIKDNKEINKEVKDEEKQNKLEEWNESDQKALEQALKKYPASLPANERWTSIASEVPGKSKKQCVDRFKFLSSKIKTKQEVSK